MKRKFFSILIPALVAAGSMHAQFKVLAPSGKVKVGLEPPASTNGGDVNNILRMQIFGPNGDFRSGGKLGFGDCGSVFAWNVFVGEYGDNDVDQLWLNGRMGMYLTYGGNGQNVIGFYDPSQGNVFHYNCDVYGTSFVVASDANFKTNVKKISGALEQLNKLNGVSYNLLPHELNKAGKSGEFSTANSGGTAASGPLSEKERKSKAFFDKLEQEQNKPGPKRLGLIAQEVEKVFPELVRQDSSNYRYVDYIGLIPVLLEGIKEQQTIIDAQAEKMQELENRLSNLEEKLSGLDHTATGMNDVNGQAGAVSYLFQNTPNPFRATTTITYFLSATVKTATVNIFDMQGSLIKAVPLPQATGKGQLSVNGSELKPGMYIYNLVTDGQEADVKRMTLIK